MPPFLGKSGADAVARNMHLICGTLKRFGPKLELAITAAETGGIITAAQADVARAFISTATATCDIFKLIAGNSGY